MKRAKRGEYKGGVVAKFEEKILECDDTGCWYWAGCLDRDGYGQFVFSGKMTKAHRTSYSLYRGKIPDTYTIDHLCWNKACCNPEHLEPVSRGDNVKRYWERRD